MNIELTDEELMDLMVVRLLQAQAKHKAGLFMKTEDAISDLLLVMEEMRKRLYRKNHQS